MAHMNLTDAAIRRCRSWVIHSGLTGEEIAGKAGVGLSTVWRLKDGKEVSTRSLRRIEAAIPKNWRDPLPAEREVA